MWKDDGSGKTKKKGGEGKHMNMNMKESMKKTFQRKVSGVLSHFAIGLLSETIGWNGSTSGTQHENHCISLGSMCSSLSTFEIF